MVNATNSSGLVAFFLSGAHRFGKFSFQIGVFYMAGLFFFLTEKFIKPLTVLIPG
jgi:hypothetical protein